MKLRNGFVSNSSSSSFLITNKTNKDLTLVDFVKDNPQIIEKWNEGLTIQTHLRRTQDEFLKSTATYSKCLKANSDTEFVFPDEGVSQFILEYILLEIGQGESEKFKWKSLNENKNQICK